MASLHSAPWPRSNPLVLAALCASAGVATAQSAPRILAPGTELVYAANGVVSPAWRVDSVAYDLTIEGRAGCVRVRFAPGGPRPEADERLTCTGGDTLFAWDGASRSWRVSRPIAPGRTLDVQGRGRTSRYEAGSMAEERISGRLLQVLETTVTTFDSSGTPLRRLRERYAPVLGTATWGTFETPDPAAPGGWRVTTEFELKEIREP